MDDLARFRTAQETTYESALRELNAGRKSSHWMWFIFPQLRGLGRSATAQHYGIADRGEARGGCRRFSTGSTRVSLAP